MPDPLQQPCQNEIALQDTKRVLGELASLLSETEVVLGGPLSEQGGLLARLDELKWINPHLPIGWPVMPKRLVPKLAAYLKKIVRVALRWYINPLVEQQNRYNETLADTCRALSQELARLESRLFELEASLDERDGNAHVSDNAL
jgi:hypothetical protein